MLEALFPNFEKALLDDIERLSTRRFYEPGRELLLKGERVPGVFIITKGFVKAYQQNEEGSEFIITYAKPGDAFGVSVTADSAPQNRKALLSYKAMEQTEACLMPFSHKDALCKKYDCWHKYVLDTAVQYYRYYLELISLMAFGNKERLIEFFLQRLSESKNAQVLDISHQEIAAGLGTSREVVSRLLKKMEGEGKVKLNHNKILLTDKFNRL